MQVTFELEYDASADVYARVFLLNTADAGEVFDFDAGELAFAPIGSAVEGFIEATEIAALGGTTKSGYVVTLDLGEIAPGPTLLQLALKWYDNATPAAADETIGEAEKFMARFSRLGNQPVRVEMECTNTSASGVACHLAAWLECGGEQVVNLSDLDDIATDDLAVEIVARELTSEDNQFTAEGDVADVINDVFELEQALPAFTSDRQYIFTCSITLDGVTFTTIHNRPVIG